MAFALLLLFAQIRHRAAPHLTPQRILWIGAHPDDETLVAPLLGSMCSDGPDHCSLLVMTRGEAGGDPSVRTSEMQNAAALFDAQLTQWSFADVMAAVDATWSEEAGGHDELLHRIGAVIAAERPDVIYTFDPNHGSTCHPAHRAVGALVLEAAAPLRIPVRLVETAVDFLPDGFFFHPATDEAAAFDVRAAWQWIVRDAEVHASQFTSVQVDALRHTPDDQRRVWLATSPAQKYSCDR